MPESHVQEAKPHVEQLPLSVPSSKTFILLLQPRTAHRPQPATSWSAGPSRAPHTLDPAWSVTTSERTHGGLVQGQAAVPSEPAQRGRGQQPYLSQVWL